MSEDKKYYWIKLKTDFFNQDAIDFLMSQENGCEYIVLYQMLCLQTANTKGVMAKQVGEMIVPYDAKKISRSEVDKLNGTIIECNTAYPGKRNTYIDHIKVAKEHGFDFAPIDIMDKDEEKR